ncbi:unnamed protein product [Mucor fragilis]
MLKYSNGRRVKLDDIVLQRNRSNAGYVVVEIEDKPYRVHRIVAFTWLPSDDFTTKTHVNHMDRRRDNNAVMDLEWTTVQESQAHAHRRPVVMHDARDASDHYISSIKDVCGALGATHCTIDRGSLAKPLYIFPWRTIQIWFV